MAKQRKRRTLTDLFLDKLNELSNGDQKFIGNRTLRDSLEWESERYDRIKMQLVNQNKIVLGRGHGGSVGLADAPGTKALSLFISYSHQDEDLKQSFLKHLMPLKRLNLIDSWSDRKIKPGEEWDKAISKKLEKADIILLLISIDFINSDYCYDVELERALELKEKGKTEIIPVILRPCMWEHCSFSSFQALPKDARPVTLYNSKDEAFVEIASGIKQVAIRIRDSR